MPDTNNDMPSEDAAPEEELAPYLIEAARSSRSKCRTCKRKIDKDLLRIGILLEGPYGTGYLWHHLTCPPPSSVALRDTGSDRRPRALDELRERARAVRVPGRQGGDVW